MAATAAEAALALLLGALAAAVYWNVGAPAAAHQSTAPHFVLLADAWLHGHLWIDPVRARSLGDVTPHGSRVYVAFPPLPAALMLPFVARFGPTFNDARFTLWLGAINIALVYLVVRRLSAPGFAGPGLPLGRLEAVLVAATFGFGTVHFYSSLMGRVWFTAHVVAVTFLLLYVLECAGRGRPLVAGLALAAAFLARTPTALAAVLWLTLAWRQRPVVWPWLWRATLLAAPGLVALALLLAQNAARFGSPWDFGYLSMRVASGLAPDLHRYGQFSAHFLPRNLAALLVEPPIREPAPLARWWAQSGGLAGVLRHFTFPPRRGELPFPIRFDPWGAGLWAVSPALLFALRPPRAVDRALYFGAWLGVGAVALPNLLYYNTGWYQYGYRFSLDFLPLLLVPFAGGLRRPLHPAWWALFTVLLLISVGSNLLGARWFLRLPPY